VRRDVDHVVTTGRPTVAIALGGGARGIAHVLALEALDEVGVRPVAIAGTSMGAVIGAAYAAGLEARAIRAHFLRVLCATGATSWASCCALESADSPILCFAVGETRCSSIPKSFSIFPGRLICEECLRIS
jgi:predicted acylesterase/phospholipase RssA